MKNFKTIAGTAMAVALAAGLLVSAPSAVTAQTQAQDQELQVSAAAQEAALRGGTPHAFPAEGEEESQVAPSQGAEVPVGQDPDNPESEPIAEEPPVEVPVEEAPVETDVPVEEVEPQVETGTEVIPEIEVKPEAQSQSASLPVRQILMLKITHRSNAVSLYEDGFFFDMNVTATGITKPTEFSGRFVYSRMSNGKAVELASEPVKAVFKPGEAVRVTSKVKDLAHLKFGIGNSYWVEYYEDVPVFKEGAAPVEVKSRRTSTYLLTLPKNASTIVQSSALMGATKCVGLTGTVPIEGQLTTGAQGLRRTVVVQRWDAKKKDWVKHADAKYDRATGKFSYTLTKTAPAAAYRVMVPSYFMYGQTVSRSLTVDRTRTKAWIGNTGLKYANQRAGVKNSLTVQVASLTATKGQTLTLQHWDAKKAKWVASSSAKAKAAKAGTHTFALPTGNSKSASSTTKYRVLLSANDFHVASASASVKVALQGPAKMSALEREYFNHSKKYCPTTVVRVSNAKMQGKYWGLAFAWENVYYVGTAAPKADRKTIALHECAHMKQYQAQSKSTKNLKPTLDKVYGGRNGSGKEIQADCIANSWSRNSYWGYKNPGKCGSAAQKKWTKAVAAGRLP